MPGAGGRGGTGLDDPELRERWGQRGREHSLARFSVERLVDDIQSLYARLLGAAC